MDRAVDLERLGAALRSRREALGLTREELSQRIGLTGAYIWMVESAAPRKGRARTRPRRATLLRWLEALEMDQPEINRMLVDAGYVPIDEPRILASRVASPLPVDAFSNDPVGENHQAQREDLIRRLNGVLDRSEASDEEWQEAATLLTTLLDFAEYKVYRTQRS